MAWTVSTVENTGWLKQFSPKKKLRTWWLAQIVNTREKANNMVAWTVSTIENRVAQTVNTHERTKNNGGLNSSTIDNRVAQTVNTCEKANNMVAWTVSTIKNWVAKTVNTREKATNMVAWIVSTIENRVDPTVNTHERTTPVEEQILTMKNSGNRMSPTVSEWKQQNMTIQPLTWHTKLTSEQHPISLIKLCSYLWDNF